MSFTQLSISDCWLFEPRRFTDARGFFQESFKHSDLVAATGIDFSVRQVNQSLSSAGVVRGIHWADVPPGQAKYVSVSQGKIVDFMVDLRGASPTFGRWEAVELSFENGRSLVIGNGIGHAFLSLAEGTVVTYLCSEEYNPSSERTLNPLDTNIGIPFEQFARDAGLGALSFSPKDENGPSLQLLIDQGILPV